jgi:hypothetical protein
MTLNDLRNCVMLLENVSRRDLEEVLVKTVEALTKEIKKREKEKK